MKFTAYLYIIIFIYLIPFIGCATYRAKKIGSTVIQQAQDEIPEDQLIDVGILVFESEE
jgi:hypothetical protein